MEKYWKAFCLISATCAVGISIGMVGPFVYHEINNSDTLRPGILSCLFASRGIGSLIGTSVSTYLLTKSNQSFWLCSSLLMLASSIVLLPWSISLAVVAVAITIQGLATAMTKSCTQNLLRFYHGFAPIGSSVLKLMHVAFAFGCFMALVCVIMFTNISSHTYLFLPTSKYNSNDSLYSQAGHTFSVRNIVKRSVPENFNSSSGSSTNLSVISTLTNESKTMMEFENSTNLILLTNITTSLQVLNVTLSPNETNVDFNSSDATNSTLRLDPADIHPNSSDITNATFTLLLQNVTTPIPTKPAVIDSNNANHHKDAADGNIIKKQLKEELHRNPLDGKPQEATKQTNATASFSLPGSLPLHADSTSGVLFNQSTTSLPDNMPKSYITTTPYLNVNLSNDLDNSTSHENNATLNSTMNRYVSSLHSTSNVSVLVTPLSTSRTVKLSDIASTTATTTANIVTTSTTTITTATTLSMFEATTSLSTTRSLVTIKRTTRFMTANILTENNGKNLISKLESDESPANGRKTSDVAESDSANHRNNTDEGEIEGKLTQTPAVRNTTIITSIGQKAQSPRLSTMTYIEPKQNIVPKITITHLDSLESLIHAMAWDSSSSTNGFYLLSFFVFLVSGMLAINSGLCGKSKSCRSYPEVNYTCSEKDSLTFVSSMHARLSLMAFHWSYTSFELLVSGLLSSYFAYIGGLSLHVGVAATCLFWFSFVWGRILFYLLAPLARLFRMTFLAIFLTLICLVAFLCVLHATASLPWYFFACMISLTAFFFSLINPSFQGYRENFPLLSYNPPLQDVLCSCGEVVVSPIACMLSFVGGDCHLIWILAALMAICLLSVYSFKFFAVPKKSKASRRKTSFTSTSCGENGEEIDFNASSFEVGSTSKLLLP